MTTTIIVDVNGMVEIVVEQETNIKPHIALNANARILPLPSQAEVEEDPPSSSLLDNLPKSRPDDEENFKDFFSNIIFCFIIYSEISTISGFDNFGNGNSYVIIYPLFIYYKT